MPVAAPFAILHPIDVALLRPLNGCNRHGIRRRVARQRRHGRKDHNAYLLHLDTYPFPIGASYAPLT
ncbi:hypothetical protein D3C72_2405030 [compost metagenome]